MAVGEKKMRVCNDASHEKGLERDADKLMNCYLILIHHPPSQSWQLELLQRGSFMGKKLSK